ncbi:multidrug effflux MFS transporter [Elioraea thermophila]|uniref:multidrug effflux MFS transporter n=1 Tax=Elioraea thermophila TaxID=2185104 RepID=UPI000DF2F18E|nr:multidrug effflux MFS transporter [Elioraea thermophila]
MSPRDDAGADVTAEAAPARGLRPAPPTWLLVALTSIGPFTLQILVPSLPGLAHVFGVPAASAQLALTGYLAGVAVGQLLYGPLSDRYGRKPLAVAGLALFLAASLGSAFATTVGGLILGRIVQAVGGCSGMVLARAMIRDCFPRDRAASVMAFVLAGMTAAPMLAPVVGGLLDEAFGWRAILLLTALAGAALLAAVLLRLEETLPAPHPLPGVAGFLRANLGLLRLPGFLLFAGAFSASSGVFFSFLGGAPFVVVSGLGLAPTTYGLAFALVSIAYAGGNMITARLAQRFGIVRLLRFGTALTFLGAALALALVLLRPPSLLNLFGPALLMAVGNGIAQANALAGAVSVRPGLAGTASGLAGALQMGFGALATVLVGATETGSGVATAAAMLASAALCQAILFVGSRRALL